MSRKAHINVVVSLDDLLCFKQVFEHAIARCQENMMDSLNGKDIKSYQFLEEIGNGAFGVVYRARQSDLREVAIKVISPYYANDPDFIRRFEKEAQIVARLEHPHIVRLYDYWRDVTGAYLVMQFLRGGSLKDLIERGPLNLDRIAALLSQIAEGLDFAHRHKVIHRDIKPDNIMLDEDGRTYVADFGIALDTGLTISDTQSGAIVGSPVYLSPEQAMSRPLGAQSDVYCLGIVLYQMLTGELPFNGTFTEILLKHVNEPVPEITSIPANVQVAVNDVLQKATNKKPEQRYSSTVDFAEAFKQAVSSQVAVSSVVPSTDALLFVPTARELEILSALVRGLQNAEIAAELHLSEGTIRNYLTEIYRKLGVRSRNQAREHVLKHGLFDSDGTVLKASLPIQAPPVPVNVINPYKGLQAFTYADADDFFGREALTDQLIERLAQPQRFIAIVGPSGSGKSSVIKAGLLPALGRGDLPGAEHWFVAEMMPKNRPLDQLEVLLQRQATSVHVNVGEQLRRDAHGLVRLAAMLLPDDDSELLLVIDQFEELFTLVDDETERQYFLDMIATAVTTEYSRVRVVITLRADFFDRPLCYARFGDLLRNHMETVLPLTAEELEQAIVRPASACGIQYEAGLVTRIVQDVLHQPGGLPLLQYALTELFERHEGQIIPRYAYDAIGGVAGALAREADALFLQQDGIGQKLIRQFFLRLVTPGDGTEDSRRRAERAELLSLTEAPDLMNEIIDAFVERRLLATDHDPNGRQPTVEVAHEALLRSWDHLRNWVNYSRAEVHLVRQVEQLSERWQKSDYDSGYLVQGSPLDELEPLLSSESVRLTPNEKAFLEASLKDRKQRKERDEARKAREAQIARRASSFQRASLLLGMMVIIAIVATLITGWTAVDANRTLAGVPPTLTEVGQQVADAEQREAAAVTAVSEGQATLDAVNTQVVIVEATLTQAAIIDDITGEFANILLQERDSPAAQIARANRLIERYPEVPLAWQARGLLYDDQEDFERALADYDRALEIDAQDIRVYTNRARAYFRMGDYERALADYDRALEIDPADDNTFVRRGSVYMSLGDYEEAIIDLDRALEINPDNERAYLTRGNAYLALDDYERALSDYDRAVEINPDSSEFHIIRGGAYATRLGDYERALDDYDRAIEIDPTCARAYFLRAFAYTFMGDFERAIIDYDRAIEIDPADAEFYYQRGDAYRDLSDLEAALADYDRAITLDPQYAAPLVARGNAYVDLSDFDRAFADFDRALEIDPENGFAYINRGIAGLFRFIETGSLNRQAIQADFEMAIALGIPVSDDLRNILNTFGINLP